MRLPAALVALTLLGCATVAAKPTPPPATKPFRNQGLIARCGMHVTNKSSDVINMLQFDLEVEHTMVKWQNAMAQERRSCDVRKIIGGINATFVDRGELERQGKQLDGLAFATGVSEIEVTMFDKMSDSALGHEIGHVVEYKCMGKTTNETLEVWHKKYGTPY